MSDFPFEHLHWTMELKTAVRTPHVSNWLSCWGFSQRWANKSFLMKSAFLWIITGCALWINPRVSDCQSREEEPLNCGSCHHVPAHSKLKTHQHNLLLPPSVLLRFICLALHFLYFFFCLFCSCLFVWGFVINEVTESCDRTAAFVLVPPSGTSVCGLPVLREATHCDLGSV